MNTEHELLIDLLQGVDRELAEQMKAVFEKHDILPTTMLLASKINRNPGITISELSRVSRIAKSHVSNTIEQLAKRGWVEKKLDPADHRIVQIYLTEEARKYYGIIRSDIREYMEDVVKSLPHERIADLISGLGELKAALEEAKQLR
jgi:DNA-binding MarR family transcriptional regulator